MQTYDANTLSEFENSLQMKLMKYREQKVNTQEQNAKLQLKLN